jgi:uncharacterized membrane protein
VESLLVFGVIAAIFYLIVLPIIAFTASGRANEVQRQADALKARLARAEAEIAAMRAATASRVAEATQPAPVQDAAPIATAPVASPELEPEREKVVEAPTPEPAQIAATPPPVLAEASATKPEVRATEAVAAPPPKPARSVARKHEAQDANPLSGIIGWFFKGNPLAKIGSLLLFFGLAYLFKYSVDHALIPIELRLAGAGLLSLGLLGIGWRLRVKQALYGLILQGTAIGAFYLTAFAAFRLYQLLPHGAVFALMIVICAASVVLSVLQRAQSLAVIAALGGYLAPVLLSTGGGSHVALFSYYAMLSVGILAVSVWQIWRPLNLIGFVFTFGVAALWARDNYAPAFYASCQFFLVLNFVIFGLAAPLAALRKDLQNLRFVDGSLVFGTPLLAFGMQYALMREQGWPMGAAYACLALGAIYLPLARALMRRWPEAGRRMALSFIALGGGFVTLAIPLALSARWTSLAWAFEGLGLVWVGLAQRHRRMAWSGTLLIALAGVSAAVAWPLDTVTMLLIFGVLALCCLAAGLLWSRATAGFAEAQLLSIALWAGGILAWFWWAYDGAERLLFAHHLSQSGSLDAYVLRPAALLAGLAVSAASACIWMFAGERLRWRLLRHSAWLLWPVAVLTLASALLLSGHPAATLLQAGAWIFTLACAALILKRSEADVTVPRGGAAAHVGLYWLVLAVCGTEIWWRIADLPWGYDTLGPVIALGTLALAILVVVALERRPWPVRAHPAAWWLIGLAPVFALTLLALLSGNFSDGQVFGWSYVPLVNPLEEAAAFALLMLCLARRRLAGLHAASRLPATIVIGALAAWWFNGALVRALSHYGDIAWDFDALWDSRLIQTTFALVWTLAAMAIMVLGKRGTSRPVWILGASVLGIVVAKLFLVDSARGGGLARAIAFIGVAILVLLIGYIAPLPPRQANDAERAA